MKQEGRRQGTVFKSDVTIAVVQLLNHVQLFATPWTEAYQASLSFTISQSLLRFMSVKSVMLSKYLILCHPFSFSLQPFPVWVFSNELAFHIN